MVNMVNDCSMQSQIIADSIYSRGVLVLQETKFIPLSIWAQ